ncbi:Exo-1,4-beta-xylosidase xlnD [Cladobotryum mycophilum]|uniref:Exo-1,4-beta-xylosidase xlnD n=1 Tax=Cladobotryum mycophilum TaxID=491253 RepID=A0ABR0SVZ4_9HYPO
MANLTALAVLTALLPSLVGAQNNQTYVNYSSQSQPDLFPQTLASLDMSFPDCANGPLKNNLVCNTSANYVQRVETLISLFTLEELINNTQNSGPGVPRFGLPAYQVWNEALHGLDRANFAELGSEWNIIATQARAFNSVGRYGLDSYAPNINDFRSPLWGRGQETPGEDAVFLTSAYTITLTWGSMLSSRSKICPSTTLLNSWCHRATPSRRASCVRKMPSMVYLAAPTVYNVFNPHGYDSSQSLAAAVSLKAGTDIDCGQTFPWHLIESFIEGHVSRGEIERPVTHLYANLVRIGYFDGNQGKYCQLGWKDVETGALNIAYEAAVEGIVLLKNDGALPLSKKVRSLALIGPWANATTQLQENYFGAAPYLAAPLQAAKRAGLQVEYGLGPDITSNNTSDFAKAIQAAKQAGAIIYVDGIDNTIEAECTDHMNLTWPGNRLDLILQLGETGKPLVVLQMGGGQVDSSAFKNNKKVNALVWGGYPGQSGGTAIVDNLSGKHAPAGRLVMTQYPAEYATQFPVTDMNLRPDGKLNPGQTYM